MKLINKKYLKGFTLSKEYEFYINNENIISCSCYSVFDDEGEELVISKYKIFEYFTFNITYKQNNLEQN